jgi:DNA-binding transcriptional regulator YhcF (GntR family)
MMRRMFFMANIRLLLTTEQDGGRTTGVYLSTEFLTSERFTRLQGSVIKVLLNLVSHMSSTEFKCHPSMATIAKETGLTVSTVQSSLKVLKSEGYIKSIAKKVSKKTRQEYNIYTLSEELVDIGEAYMNLGEELPEVVDESELYDDVEVINEDYFETSEERGF